MDRWRGKTAVVTGSSSGIGAAITRAFLSAGINVVGLDVQYDIQNVSVAKETECVNQNRNSGTLYPIHCDVSREEDIHEAFAWVEENLDGCQILVNNAGVINYNKITASNYKVFERLLRIDVLAVAACIGYATRSMKSKNLEGHIFNINSKLGHTIPSERMSDKEEYSAFNIYPACKHATVAMTNSVRNELKDLKTPIRITSICPGLVKTEITKKFPGLENFFDKTPAILPEDIAGSIMYALGLRTEVEISELLIGTTGSN